MLPRVEIGLALERAERSRSKGRDPAAEIVRKSLEIAGEICIYSNTQITVLELNPNT